MKNITDKLINTNEISLSEICEILSLDNTDYLFEKAYQIRNKRKENTVKISGLIQLCNICSGNCLYCGNRKDNQKQRHTLSVSDTVNISKEFSKEGIKDIILKSCNTSFDSLKNISEIIGKLKVYNINTIPSFSELNEAECRILQESETEGISLNIVTSSFTMFGELHPDMNLIGRIMALRFIKKHNLKTSTGILVGFPNQTMYSLADDILTLKNLNINSIEIIPFIPEKNTPYENEEKVKIDKILKIIAATRLILPESDILISENICEIDSDGITKALLCGADTIIKNLTDSNCNKKDTNMSYLKKQILSAGFNG